VTRTSWRAWLVLAPAFLSWSCGNGSPVDMEVMSVRAGTSFGFCVPTAYCETTLEVVDGSAVLTRSSRTLGDVRTPGTLTQGEWEALLAAVDEDTLRALPAVVGCPDCADGGAEWVEVVAADWTKRVTFEYGAAPREIEALAERLRRIRTRLAP
jgi:hypothetical protein